jgi:hypothetical protein
MNKCATFSTIGLGLSQHCMKMLWWWLLVPVQNVTESATVRRWNSETLRFCEEV